MWRIIRDFVHKLHCDAFCQICSSNKLFCCWFKGQKLYVIQWITYKTCVWVPMFIYKWQYHVTLPKCELTGIQVFQPPPLTNTTHTHTLFSGWIKTPVISTICVHIHAEKSVIFWNLFFCLSKFVSMRALILQDYFKCLRDNSHVRFFVSI